MTDKEKKLEFEFVLYGGFVGHWIPMCALIALGYVTADEKDLAIFLLVVAVGINSATYLGFQVSRKTIDFSSSPAFCSVKQTKTKLNRITKCTKVDCIQFHFFEFFFWFFLCQKFVLWKQVNHIDIAPNFAGTLMGLTNGMVYYKLY